MIVALLLNGGTKNCGMSALAAIGRSPLVVPLLNGTIVALGVNRGVDEEAMLGIDPEPPPAIRGWDIPGQPTTPD